MHRSFAVLMVGSKIRHHFPAAQMNRTLPDISPFFACGFRWKTSPANSAMTLMPLKSENMGLTMLSYMHYSTNSQCFLSFSNDANLVIDVFIRIII
jgi:hypothetical protein